MEREPCLDDLPALLDRTRGSGVDARLAVTGAAEVPRSVQVAVYRVVQESLTNVRKHAGEVRAEVKIVAEGSEIVARVRNPPGDRLGRTDRRPVAGRDASTPTPAVGAGLVGMRERVALFGGRLDAGQTTEGGFEVCARIPLSTAVLSPGAA